MRHGTRSLLLVFLAFAFAGIGTWGVIFACRGLSASTNGWILGAGAVLFAISEGFFTRLLTELNGVLRATGYSVWQMERLRDVVLPFKKRLWRLWWLSQLLKIVCAVCAVILQKETLTVGNIEKLLWVGFVALFLALACSIWLARSFLLVEKIRDNLAADEVAIKERKRLASIWAVVPSMTSKAILKFKVTRNLLKASDC